MNLERLLKNKIKLENDIIKLETEITKLQIKKKITNSDILKRKRKSNELNRLRKNLTSTTKNYGREVIKQQKLQEKINKEPKFNMNIDKSINITDNTGDVQLAIGDNNVLTINKEYINIEPVIDEIIERIEKLGISSEPVIENKFNKFKAEILSSDKKENTLIKFYENMKVYSEDFVFAGNIVSIIASILQTYSYVGF